MFLFFSPIKHFERGLIVMNIRWVSYKLIGRNLESDIEKLMLFDCSSEGIHIYDLYRYMTDISFIYANLYAEKVLSSVEQFDFVFEEIYRQNGDFWEKIKNAFAETNCLTLSEVEALLADFQIPNIQV